MGEIIGGTVIQRSFIGRETSNIIHIATVPISELGIDLQSPELLLSDVLGIPATSILDSEKYRLILNAFQNEPPEFMHWPWHSSKSYRKMERLYKSLNNKNSNSELFTDFITTVGGLSSNNSSIPFLFNMDLNHDDSEELFPELVGTAFQCLSSRFNRSSQTESFINEVFLYDIPMGQSPSVKSDNLLQLLETSKSFCIAPLALGGAQGVTQLSQGNYVAALLTTGTAGAMTLVLIGTVSVGALIVQKVAQARAKTKFTKSS